MQLTVEAVASGSADLTFQEERIKSGAMAIALGFKAIAERGLWQFKKDRQGDQKYLSFEAYCDGEWGHQYAYRSIQWFLTEAKYFELLGDHLSTVTTLDVTGTNGRILHDTPMPSNLSQTQALRGAGGTIEDQAQIWQDTLDEVGGDPKDATVTEIKKQIDKAFELTTDEFPLGTPVSIHSEIPGVVFDGYEGYVLEHLGGKSVYVQCQSGRIAVLVDWLTKLDKPMVVVEQPKPRPKPVKKSPLEAWKEDAIALFNRIYLEVGDHLPLETKQIMDELINRS